MGANKNITKNSSLRYLWGLIPVILLLLLWIVPILEIETRASQLPIKDKIELEDKLRTTLAQIFGGLFLLSGAYFSWRTLNQNKESQITDRFYKAVEQLGNIAPKNQAVQIGGVFALERIAIDSPKDHWTIMEVLCSYIRMNSPVAGPYEKVVGHANLHKKNKGGSSNTIFPDHVIQTIITVLGRRNTLRESVSERLDLRNTYLRGANFTGGDFSKTLFDGSHLEWSKFNHANLENTSFNDSHMEMASLRNTTMIKSSFIDSYMEGADLRNSNLSDSNLLYSHIQDSIVNNCNVKGAKFDLANITNVDIGGFVNLTDEQIGEAVVRLDPNDNALTIIKEMKSSDREKLKNGQSVED